MNGAAEERVRPLPRRRGAIEVVPSVCPHDCTSTCALEVERLDPRTHRPGAWLDAEHLHGRRHLREGGPLRRAHPSPRPPAPPRSGASGRRARHSSRGSRGTRRSIASRRPSPRRRPATAARRSGRTSTRARWGWSSATASTGCATSCGYSRWLSTICVALSDTGWIAGRRRQARRGSPRGGRALGPRRDLGRQSGQHSGQRHDRTSPARSGAGAKLVVVDPVPDRHGGARRRAPGPPPGHRRRARVRRDARPLRRGLRGLALHAPLHRRAGRAGRAPADADARLGCRDHGPDRRRRSSTFARLYGQAKRSFIRCHHGFSRSRNGAANMHAVSCLPAVTGAWQHPGGGAIYGQTAIYPLDRSLIEGLDRVDPHDPRARPVACSGRS